ncbi:unnamed protein product [Ectocarpus fasciculatus]
MATPPAPSAGSAAPAAVQPADEDDRFASPPGLWLPRMVVKEHRQKATFIWIGLLVGFLAYVGYIIWETVESRKDPASSIELKQEYYTFPDVALCTAFGKGCLDYDNDCFEDNSAASMFNQTGFLDYDQNFTDDHAYASDPFEEAYPHCKYIPLSKMTVDETGVMNGSVTSFSTAFYILWDEKDTYYDHSYYLINRQFLDMYLIPEGSSIESFTSASVDAKVPYSRINLTSDTDFEATINHMVLSLTEFTGINENGNKEEKQRTFAQATITGIEHWWWGYEDYDSVEYSFFMVELSIGKFEFTSIEEVDPVDGWSIIGAIGGIWQFVVTGFGLFFVFSEKQSPDRKMRNFRKSIGKPAEVVNKRLSSLNANSRSSNQNQDVEIDASEEDLPVEWVKKQRPNGSIYYFNVMTGAKQTASPNHLDATGGAAPPPSNSALGRIFQGNRSARLNSGPLPAGWVEGTDGNGKQYYLDTIHKTTQWERPTQREHSSGGPDRRPLAVDAPVSQSRRFSHASSDHSHHSHHSASSQPPHHRQSLTAAGAAPGVEDGPHVGGTPAPSLGNIPAAPSYRTAVFLSNSAATAAASEGGGTTQPQQQQQQQEVLRAPAGTKSTDSRAGARGAAANVDPPLPQNWSKRTAPNNRPYYVNSVTKKTQVSQ